MKKLLAMLVATMFAAVTFSAYAAGEAKPLDAGKPAKAGKKHHKQDMARKPEVTSPAKQ